MAHGTGFVDEYPFIPHFADWETDGYDGVLMENMVVSVESYIGEAGGKEGVKLEQQAVITSTGAQVLSESPFLDALEL
jgi:Xaa-Pro aminopeptidase